MNGTERIAAERQRQIEVEKWTAKHDDEHNDGELALAAVCYASPQRIYVAKETTVGFTFEDPWPWDGTWDKRRYPGSGNVVAPNFTVSRKERIRQLEKSGALIAAEIDRLLRKEKHAKAK